MPIYICKVCHGRLSVSGNTRDIDFTDKGKTPYGGRYPHASTLECPLMQGLSEEQLKAHPQIEVVG